MKPSNIECRTSSLRWSMPHLKSCCSTFRATAGNWESDNCPCWNLRMLGGLLLSCFSTLEVAISMLIVVLCDISHYCAVMKGTVDAPMSDKCIEKS